MSYTLQRYQQLPCDLETAWRFFATPENLARITPLDMRFRVVSPAPDQPIFVGMLINYQVSPLFGIPLKWQTKITQIEPMHSFTDFQNKGPFAHWAHHHEFIPNAEGVLMKDTVTYTLPQGLVGRWVHSLVVKNRLNQIFDFRSETLKQLFNRNNHTV